jgi:hypothetical protein
VLPAASWLTLGRIRGPELLEQFVGPPGRRAPSEVEEPARHDQVLPAGQDVVDRRLLAGEADPAAHRGRLACDVEARDLGAPRVGPQQGGEHPHDRRLAGPVRPEQPARRALGYRQVEESTLRATLSPKRFPSPSVPTASRPDPTFPT